jgi:hypothetical protein
MTERFIGVAMFIEDCATPRWFTKVPKKFSEIYKEATDNFGFIPITAHIGEYSWPTSLLPSGKGKGTHFLLLPKKAREINNIELNEKITVEFELRERK